MPNIGIDTVKMGVQRDFEIEDYANLRYVNDTDMKTGAVRERYYRNDTEKGYYLTIDRRGLSIQFSLPLLYGLDSNFYLLGANSIKVVMSSIERELQNIGVVADLDNAKVMRIDIVSNALTTETFSSYAPVLQSLSLKRARNRQYGVDTFLMHNTLRELEFYNKLRELAQKKGPAYVRNVLGFNSERIVRGELRFLRHREVKKRLGVSTLQELPDNWGTLRDVYVGFMRNEVFTNSIDNEISRRANLEELFGVLAGEALRALVKDGIEAFKIYGFLPFFYVSDDEIKKALLESKSRRQAYRILQRIKRAKKKYGFVHMSKAFKRLYSELKYKFTN